MLLILLQLTRDDAVVHPGGPWPRCPLLDIAMHSGTRLAVCEVRAGPLRGLGPEGGVRAAGERAGDASNSRFALPT